MKYIFSCGDINGIGLEVFYLSMKNLQSNGLQNHQFALVINSDVLIHYFNLLNFKYDIIDKYLYIYDYKIEIIELNLSAKINFGENRKDAGELAIKSLEQAFNLTYSGEYDALITLPISKKSCIMAGFGYTDHTSFFAAKCNINEPLMLFVYENIRLMIATIHISLNDVSNLLTFNKLSNIIEAFVNTLKVDFGLNEPSIAILGLNPHSGESGEIGNEEIDTIIPVINKAKKNSFKIEGPFPADGFFASKIYKQFDGIIAMYHDQGLIPIKILADNTAVNCTCGLPIIRTSPDHGTAFNIAGKNLADERSLVNAIYIANEIFENRKNISF